MAKKVISKRSVSAGSKRTVLESITGDDALAILKVLAARDRSLQRKIEEVAMAHFSPVEMDAIAADVVMELEALDVEKIWRAFTTSMRNPLRSSRNGRWMRRASTLERCSTTGRSFSGEPHRYNARRIS
jgi:hypothetical protein